ncbi:MAG: carboxypeptidase-like regulatory domain-containing protein [Prolixibacteraceae bacterium]|nr:carboxypeptidase-like regulatory domain-containing protein [Prolixibacteraceae bacterium]
MGKIVDSGTGEQLVFVNIGIQGTMIGVASNYRGEFVLNVPMEYIGNQIYFSAIGYRNFTAPVSQFLNDRVNTVYMDPLSYGIEDIDISAQSKVLYRIIRDASGKVKENYLNKPHNYLVLYESELTINQKPNEKRSATVLTYDEKGYGQTHDAYSSRNYRLINVQRNFDVVKLEEGTTYLDELLNLDIVRSPQNILDQVFLNEFDLELIGREKTENDSVYVIAYKLAKPELSRTGDLYATSYQGKIYITYNNNIVLKNETHIKSERNSLLGRSIAPPPEKAMLDVDYAYCTTYKNYKGKYCLESVTLTKNFFDKEGNINQLKTDIKVISVNDTKVEPVNKRQYYEELVSDHDFWIEVNRLMAGSD